MTHPDGTPASDLDTRARGADGRESDIQLAVMVPRCVKRSVILAAAEQGITVRTLLLGLLREAGLAPALDDAELGDRRAKRPMR